jgi:hypothetical protein
MDPVKVNYWLNPNNPLTATIAAYGPGKLS